MDIRPAKLTDKNIVLALLDQFRSDCIEQVTGKNGESHTARENGSRVFESLIVRPDYGIFLLEDLNSKIVGIITGYLCSMLRNGGVRAEVEEFFIQKDSRGNGNAKKLMDTFFEWAKSHQAQKVNLESDNDLQRAHRFYEKYGFETKAQRYVKKIE